MDKLLRKEYFDKAFKLHSANYITEAENFYKKIISENTQDSEVYNLLGICRLQNQDFETAEKYTLKAISINPQKYFYQTLSDIYSKKQDYKKELETRLMQKEIYGLDYELAYNLGVLYKNLSDYKNSELYYMSAFKINPNSRDAIFNLANLYRITKQFDKAIGCFNQCLAMNPNDKEANYFLSLIFMQQKDYKNGLKHFESRLCRDSAIITEEKTYPNLIKADNIWSGESLNNKTLYTYYEAGFGDMIMFARYIPILEKMCKKLIVKPQIELYQLFKDNFPNSEIMGYFYKEKDLKFDYHIPFLSIPYALGLDSNTMFTSRKRYMSADDKKIKAYKQKYFNNDKFKIGIKWQGNTYYDTQRVINVEAFAKLFEIDNIQLYSFQTNEGSEEFAKLKQYGNITDLSSTFKDFSDTAAAVENMDLIISNDSSLAHLAGAMNKPCAILLPQDYNWRWHMDTNYCDWYESVKLYTNDKNESWDLLIDKVIEAMSC